MTDDEHSSKADLAAMIERKERLRYEVLSAAFVLSQGQEMRFFQLDDLARVTKRSRAEAKDAFQYLRGEGLLIPRALGGLAGITHDGSVEYEKSVKEPNQPTEDLRVKAPQHVVQHFNAPVGAVQIGDQANCNFVEAHTSAPAETTVVTIPSVPKV